MLFRSAMTSSKLNSQIMGFDFDSESAKAAETAYPLTMPIYAAVNPTILDSNLRAPYAAFIKYAASLGQVSGTDLGQLPPGYAPLGQGMIQQALQDASLIALGAEQPSATPTPNPSQSPTDNIPTDSPTTSPGGNPVQLSLGPITPNDPQLTPLAATVPFSFSAGVAASLLYPRIGRRKRNKKVSQR